MLVSKRQGTQPRLFQMVEMEALVPQNHLLRQLDRVIDWSMIHERTRALYSENMGRPVSDPELQLRLMVLCYLFNHSERALYNLLPMHAGYLWFCGLDFEAVLHPEEAELALPDRTTLVKTRKFWRDHQVFDDLMRDIVDQCIIAGLVKPQMDAAVDGTQVRANASIHSLAEIQLAPVESIEAYLVRQAKEDTEDTKTDKEDAPKPPSTRNDHSEVEEQAIHEDFHGKTFSNRTHRSTSDPDARLYKKSKGQEAHLRYLVHDLIDVHSGVILDTRASLASGTAEREVSLKQVQAIRFRHPHLQIRTLSADKGYESADYLVQLHELGIIPLIRLRSLKLQEFPVYKTRALHPVRKAKRRLKQKEIQAYNFAKNIQRHGAYRHIQALRARIEHAFAEAKGRHGLDRARSRGLDRMQEQATLTAMVQNLKRLCRFKARRPRAGALSCAVLAKITGCPQYLCSTTCSGFRFFGNFDGFIL
ncbi:Transposase DDE domain protein [Paenibacillus konkukensis]|uniref:Transposase DDE domain protein n=1 Tax=Paenibacillus konkukensis TaxID=2020716 RepID=A0ABY4RPU4_9BACL|nr:Transposase DDE domain protein [Paenibacillus konkukensis]